MSRRCPNRHHVPARATFCPECWALLAPPRPAIRRRVFWPVVITSVFAFVLVSWWAWQKLAGTDQPRGPVGKARTLLPAVFTIEVEDTSGASVSQGSGFLVDSTGRGVSAFHVLRGAERALVRMQDGRYFDVLRVSAWDSLADVVVFEVGRAGESGIQHPKVRRYPVLRVKPSPVVGEPVVVVGSPQGFTSTLSDGLVSAMRSTVNGQRMQLTAPISAGSSGGPVFDGRGRVLGVVVELWSSGQNLNFATSVNMFDSLLDEGEPIALSEFAKLTREARAAENSVADDLFEVGNVYFEKKWYARALERYELAIREDSTHAGAIYNSAVCLDHLGRSDEAGARFRRYLELPSEPDPFRRHAAEWLQRHADGKR